MLAVVLYHLWPARLTGGFVGVDVFFVISGFLITHHLARELDERGRIRLVAFWARRVRRLLPAAFVVLAASTAVVLIGYPTVLWSQNLGEVRAAALYAENWQLVGDSVDYLASGHAPSLVQHFWSLSVEEQFYLLEPLVLLLAFTVSRSKRGLLVVLAVVSVASGAYSVLLTEMHDSAAYFSTGTRAGEFALGGVAALAGLHRLTGPRIRAVLGWVGLGLIAIAVLVFTPMTSFPGWASFLPVGGTALLLAVGDPGGRAAPGRVLSLAPLRRLGDWSYAVYLWHWPLLVAIPVVLGRPMGWKLKVAVLLAALGLAAATKRYVEDRWRVSPPGGRSSRKAFAWMLAAIATVAAVTTGASILSTAATGARAAEVADRLAAVPSACLGVAAVVNGCPSPYAVTGTVQPDVAADDVPWNRGVAASTPCPGESNVARPVVHECRFGDVASPDRTIALVGDSHADHLIDALHLYATKHHIELLTFTREGCSGIPTANGTNRSCEVWSERVQASLRSRSDLDAVLFSNNTARTAPDAGDARRTFAAMRATGKAVIPVIDVAGMLGTSAPTCVAGHLDRYDPCAAAPPSRGFMRTVADQLRLQAVDLNDLLCRGGRCHAVIGGLLVYMDDNHLTLSFEQTLSDVLGDRVERAIARSD